MSNKRHTLFELATNFHLWQTYVDPDGNDSKAEFDAMTVQEKIDFINTCFAYEAADQGEEHFFG